MAGSGWVAPTRRGGGFFKGGPGFCFKRGGQGKRAAYIMFEGNFIKRGAFLGDVFPLPPGTHEAICPVMDSFLNHGVKCGRDSC